LQTADPRCSAQRHSSPGRTWQFSCFPSPAVRWELQCVVRNSNCRQCHGLMPKRCLIRLKEETGNGWLLFLKNRMYKCVDMNIEPNHPIPISYGTDDSYPISYGSTDRIPIQITST
jgi:hypothetical protein